MNNKVKVTTLAVVFILLGSLTYDQAPDADAAQRDLLLGLKAGTAFPFFLGEDYEEDLDAMGLETEFMIGFTGGFF